MEDDTLNVVSARGGGKAGVLGALLVLACLSGPFSARAQAQGQGTTAGTPPWPAPWSPLPSPGATPGAAPGKGHALPLSPLPALAQAEAAPQEYRPPPRPDEAPPASAPAPAPAPEQGEKAEKPRKAKNACESDSECPARAICVEGACQALEKRVSAVFYYHQGGANGYRIVLPFYFSFWHPGRLTRVVAPLFTYSRNDRDKSTDLFILPLLYQHHKEPGAESHRFWPILFYSNYGDKGAAFGLLPIGYGMRRGATSIGVAPPLLSFFRRDTKKGALDLLLLGMVYHGRRPDYSLTLVPPLLSLGWNNKGSGYGLVLGLGWYHTDKDRLDAGVFPLAWHIRSARAHTTVILPLFVEGGDSERGLRHVTLLPLFHYRSEESGKRRLLITPIGGIHKDVEHGVTTGVWLVPPLIHRDEPRYRFTVVPPLAVLWHNKDTGRDAGYVGPVFWSRDPEGSTVGLFPLYVRFHEKRGDATTQIFFPIAAFHRGPPGGRDFGFVGPFFGWRSKNGDDPGGGGGVFPVLWIGTGRRSHALLLPVFAYTHDRDAGTTHVSVGPLFYRQRTQGAEAGWDAGILPLLYLGRHGGTQYQTLLPVFYHRKDERKEHLVLGPLYFVRTFGQGAGDQEAGLAGGLFPLLWFKRSPARSHAVVAPVFWYAREGQRAVLVLGPVFWHRDTAPDGLSDAGGLFPLFYARRSPRSTLVLSPVVAYSNNLDTGRRVVVAGPFVQVRDRTTTTSALLPLIYVHSGPERSAQVVFPLFIQARDHETTVRTAAFLYWGVQRPGLSANVIVPVLGHVRTAASTTTWVGPFYYHGRSDGSRRAVGLLPLFAYWRSGEKRLLAMPIGFVFRDSAEERTKAAIALFYGDFRKDRSDWGVFPLVFGVRRGTASAFVGPFLYHSEDPAQQRGLTVVGPFYVGHRGPASFGGVAPLLFARSDGKGGYGATIVPLFFLDHQAQGGRTRLYTLLFGFSKSLSGYRFYLGPLYVRRDDEARTEAFFPLVYHSYAPKTEVGTTLVLPILFRRRTPESTLTVVTPLLWQYSTLTQRTVFFFPFALDVHRYYQSRLTAIGVVLPLVIRDRSYADNTTAWIFPPLLTYVKKHAEGHDAVVFPLFWYYGGHEKSTAVLLPIFYHLRRPTYRLSVLVPLYLYYKDTDTTLYAIPPLLTYVRKWADGRRTAIVFPFYYYTKTPEMERTIFAPFGAYWKAGRTRHLLVLNSYTAWGVGPRAGEWEFHFWPLFSFGRPRRQDLEWNVLGGLVGYSRLGVNRTFKLLWGVQIPLQSAPRSAVRGAWYGATLRMGAE